MMMMKRIWARGDVQTHAGARRVSLIKFDFKSNETESKSRGAAHNKHATE